MRRIEAAGGPLCCEVLTNVLYNLSRLALGLPSLTATIIERMYDERAGLFRPIAWPAPARPSPVTWAALAPLALPDLPEEIGRRLVEEQLLDSQRFWLPYPAPSVSAADPSFTLRDASVLPQNRRYWRGPTWINSAWLLWLGLVRLGYAEQAAELEARAGRMVSAQGLREYYNPFTGEGMGAIDFGWSSLVLELLEPDGRAAASYLPA
jgi:hypothetical protein